MERAYKTYIVKARREGNGKEFTDKFTAYNEADARCCFRECYRHDVYTILEVAEETEDISMGKLVLEYVGNDSFDRPVYKNGNKLFVDVEPRKDREPKICTKLNNSFDGEPDTPIQYMKKYEDIEIEFVPKRATWQ